MSLAARLATAGMAVWLGACAPALTPSAPPVVPVPVPGSPPPVGAPPASPAPVPVAAPSGRTLLLPMRLLPTTWVVERRTEVAMRGEGARQRLEEQARLTLQWERSAGGALRGRGTVDGYRLSGGGGVARSVPSLAVQVTVDSGVVQVVPDPPMVNACDREEMTAARLAGVPAPRIPDGVTVGSRWRERVEGSECRAGVVLRMTRELRVELVRWEGDEVTLVREGTGRLSGRGGRPFEVVRMEGEGTERDELVVSAVRGVVLRGSGRSAWTMRMWEGEGNAEQRLEQGVEWRVTLNP